MVSNFLNSLFFSFITFKPNLCKASTVEMYETIINIAMIISK